MGFLCYHRARMHYVLLLEQMNLLSKVLPGHFWSATSQMGPNPAYFVSLQPQTLSKIVQKFLSTAGVNTNANEDQASPEQALLSGHFLRGQAGSICYDLAILGGTWEPEECAYRAGHTLGSFFKFYYRAIDRRLPIAFSERMNNSNGALLRFEEAALL